MSTIKTKSPQEAAQKWARVTPGRQQDYVAGVTNPATDWATPTIEAKEAYETGIQEAIQIGSREAGVQAAGNSKWKANTAEKGARNWAPGVRAAQGAMQQGIAAPLNVLNGMEITDRGPVGSDQNYDRVRQIGEALRADKLRRKGGGA